HPHVVCRNQVLDLVGAVGNVVEQPDEHAWMPALVNEVVNLDQYRRWDDKGLLGGLEQSPTCLVKRVRAVQRCKKRARVEDQRHERGTGRSSPARTDVSV